ncbi:hypothetical protein PG996_003240 [Apiospora saccharicola]|uniref:Uncharacterized protein n=1 Tax=Apiospora saccharicola TaxID=335842 RepID=A0ABR1W0R3_9PEZI
MVGSSARSVYGGETPSKPSHFVTENTSSPPKRSISRKNVKSYIESKDGGGDPVTALTLRPSSSKSITDRQTKVQREMAASLALLNRSQ